jgi:hypothetical protein
MGGRVARVRYFFCRHCHQLAYTSQREGSFDRAPWRAIKIRQRLGGDLCTDMPFPPKPKGMWRRTYERLREQGMEADRLANEAFVTRAGWLLERLDKPKRPRKL